MPESVFAVTKSPDAIPANSALLLLRLQSWSATLCPEGSAYQIARAQDAQHCQYYNATQDPYFETCMAHSQAYYFSESVIIWDASEQSWMKIREMDMGNKGNCNFADGWNPNQSGYHQGPPQYSEINPAAPFDIDAADPWSDGARFWSQELGGDAYIPSSASRVVELSISKKVDTSTKIQGQGDVLNLVCLERCINMTAVMEGKVPKNGQFSPDGYEDGYAMHPNHEDVRDKALSYTYTISTGKLIDSNGVVVSMPRPDMTCDGSGDCLQADDYFGLDMRLVLANDATFAELGCANATRDTCSDLFKASSYFEFRTHFDYEVRSKCFVIVLFYFAFGEHGTCTSFNLTCTHAFNHHFLHLLCLFASPVFPFRFVSVFFPADELVGRREWSNRAPDGGQGAHCRYSPRLLWPLALRQIVRGKNHQVSVSAALDRGASQDVLRLGEPRD